MAWLVETRLESNGETFRRHQLPSVQLIRTNEDEDDVTRGEARCCPGVGPSRYWHS